MPYSVSAPMVFYSVLFYSNTCTNRMQPEVKPCKAEIQKGKNESSAWRRYAELKSGRNNELEGAMCLQSRMGKKSCKIAVLGELLSMKNESWKKCSPGKVLEFCLLISVGTLFQCKGTLEKSWNFVCLFLWELCFSARADY